MISVCILTKNDENFIRKVIESIRPFVQEVLVVDDRSVDHTVEVSTEAGARVCILPLAIETEGFASAVNYMVDQATNDWILRLDSDELVGEGHRLPELTRFPGKEAWALPRRKWLEYPQIREEYEAYPDWQLRFFKRSPYTRFEGHMHIRFTGPAASYAYRGPHIDHLQRQCRTPEKTAQRKILYEKLARIQGVAIAGGRLLEKPLAK